MRGSQFQRRSDCLDYAFGIGKHLVAPESDDYIALFLEPGCPSTIVVLLKRVLAAVDLDDEAAIGGEEIHDIGAERTCRRNLTPSIWRLRSQCRSLRSESVDRCRNSRARSRDMREILRRLVLLLYFEGAAHGRMDLARQLRPPHPGPLPPSGGEGDRGGGLCCSNQQPRRLLIGDQHGRIACRERRAEDGGFFGAAAGEDADGHR